MSHHAIPLLIVLLLACPGNELQPLPPEKINRIALAEALKAGTPGSLEFTVALRRAVARLNGDAVFVALPARGIEKDPTFARNLIAGIQANQRSTIFNGSPVTTATTGTTYDSVVAILNLQQRVECSGIAVTATRIVTAKHCLEEAEWILEGNTLAGTRVPVRKTAAYSDADLGLIFLANGGLSTTAFLPSAQAAEIDGAKQMRAVGFGANATGTSGTKAYTDVTIARWHCASGDATTFGCNIPEEMVADNKKNNADTCNGDSGGPAFVGPENRHRIAAIISRSVTPGQNCVDGSVYVRLDSPAIVKFINETQP